jgi:hypothetical protein
MWIHLKKNKKSFRSPAPDCVKSQRSPDANPAPAIEHSRCGPEHFDSNQKMMHCNLVDG